MDPNPIKTALNVCKQLIVRRVYAVIVSHPQIGDLSPAAVSYTSGFYHIPVIGISSRDSAFSDKVKRQYIRLLFIFCNDNTNLIIYRISMYHSSVLFHLIHIKLKYGSNYSNTSII